MRIEALVDTGFTDYLSLPRAYRKVLGLEPVGWYRFELADGRIVRTRVHLGRIRFHGRTHAVPIVLTRSQDALLGTQMFRGRKLIIRYARKLVRVDLDR